MNSNKKSIQKNNYKQNMYVSENVMFKLLASQLRAYSQEYQLQSIFKESFFDDDLPQVLKDKLVNCSNPFQKNVLLKEELYGHLQKGKSKKLHYWVVNKWGKIEAFKNNETNDARIDAFVSKLNGRPESRELTSDLFSCISSLSKIASFYRPHEFTIYDSRAVTSLNWLLIQAGAKESFFPVPPGRNKELDGYDIETIIRLSLGDKEKLFQGYKKAYFAYCQLLIELSQHVWVDENWRICPYYIEMLLFSLAPTVILQEIKKKVSVSIVIATFKY